MVPAIIEPPTPTPPETINDPVVDDVDAVVLEMPKPEPIFTFPLTPNPPTTVNAPLVEDVEFVLEFITVAALTVNPPVTPSPPAVIFTLEDKVATPVTDKVEEAVKAPTDVSDVWNVEAPVTPIPPEVTRRAAE
jgi:hypothetical protein